MGRLDHALLRAFSTHWLRYNFIPLSAAFLAALALYSAFATGVVLTDHTVPNSQIYDYPSYKTWLEGRWAADLLIAVFGGGNQTLQAVLGFALQALNGVLFASLLRVEGRLGRMIVALLVALHPAVLDYYGFLADNLSFTLGDTLILIAVLLIDRSHPRRVGAALAAPLMAVSLAIYQPKISVLAVVLIVWAASMATSRPIDWRRVGYAVASSLAGLAIYSAVYVLTATRAEGPRAHVNELGPMVAQALNSYAATWVKFIGFAINLPFAASWGTLALAAAGIASLLVTAARRGALPLALTILAVGLLPPALQASFIINDQGYPTSGRLNVGHAYVIAFFATALLSSVRPRWAALGLPAFTLYGMIFIGAQENNYLLMKTMFEQSLITRVVARLEHLPPQEAARQLVVIGDAPHPELDRIRAFPQRPFQPQASQPTFVFYRQIEVTNFFATRRLVTYPSAAAVEAGIRASRGMPVWPAPDAVSVVGEAVVVKFSEWVPESRVTTPF